MGVRQSLFSDERNRLGGTLLSWSCHACSSSVHMLYILYVLFGIGLAERLRVERLFQTTQKITCEIQSGWNGYSRQPRRSPVKLVSVKFEVRCVMYFVLRDFYLSFQFYHRIRGKEVQLVILMLELRSVLRFVYIYSFIIYLLDNHDYKLSSNLRLE